MMSLASLYSINHTDNDIGHLEDFNEYDGIVLLVL